MKFDKIILLGAAILAASPLPLEAKSRKGKGDVTVAVFSLNDFHGCFVRNDYKNIPGAPAVWQTLDSLKSVYPYNVTVAAGDNFGGSFHEGRVAPCVLQRFRHPPLGPRQP